jgi:membrane protein YqaA with SNARE-associated domain
MSNAISHGEQAEVEKRGRLREKIAPLLTLLLVIAISVSLLLYFVRNPERVAGLQNYGYLGAFLISLIGNATVLLFPAAVLPMLAAIGVVLYPVTGPVGPVSVGLVGGVGAGIGEIVGYMAGYSGRGIAGNNKMYLKLVGWMRRWGALAIFITSLLPFFFDLAGMVAGVLRFPLWKFLLVCWLGRTLNYVSVVLLVAVWGKEAVLRFFS